ncbi:MAG: response regulator [Dehalococcoidales bacterium]|nr:response regulator [Dehalococcoidales bacterium]
MEERIAHWKRFLVVEDEPAIAEVCYRLLTKDGFEVDLAVNGRVAQEMLDQKEYDLCLIDIRTPVMNGKELYQFIIEKHPRLINGTIFTTGDIDVYTERFLELTQRPYLPKPFTPDELRTKIKETLDRMKQKVGKPLDTAITGE